jgi:hypothetical protein
MPHFRPLEFDEIADPEIRERFEHYANTRGFTPNVANEKIAAVLEFE